MKKNQQQNENQSIPTKTLGVLPSPRSPRQAFLHITPGDLIFPLKGSVIHVGSAPSNGLSLLDPAVSRRHCVLERAGRRWWIRDLQSKNGVFVNGSKIQNVELGGGDAILIGSTTLRFAPSKGVLMDFDRVYRCGEMTAKSPLMLQVFKRIEKLADTSLAILICGESGTGKELVARALHQKSRRADKVFIPINCGALPADLLEAELFGYEKGAFTGADRPKPGVFESANWGTLFLDEIGELPISQQPALLRVLDSGQIRRLGSSRLRSTDVRIFSATNKDLGSMVRDGFFRKDLYYRLAECTISVPPLRSRPSDIPVLVEHFLRTGPYTSHAEFPPPGVLDKLTSHSWPGNIRELKNIVRRASALGWQQAMEDWPEEVSTSVCALEKVKNTEEFSSPAFLDEDLVFFDCGAKQPETGYDPAGRTSPATLDSMEKLMLVKALEKAEGSQAQAARLLKMKRSSFRLKLKRHSIL